MSPIIEPSMLELGHGRAFAQLIMDRTYTEPELAQLLARMLAAHRSHVIGVEHSQSARSVDDLIDKILGDLV